MSPPARRRGLKHTHSYERRDDFDVASRAEAWIETVLKRFFALLEVVASRAEAWIETSKD